MPKQIVGNVYWIQDGSSTSRLVDVREAFTAPDQAKAQILYAESSGDKQHLKLCRLAYRQFQGKRYRGESKVVPRRTTEVDQERISKPSREKPSKVKSTKKAARRIVARKAPKVTSKFSTSEPSKAKPSKKSVGRRAAVKKAGVRKHLAKRAKQNARRAAKAK